MVQAALDAAWDPHDDPVACRRYCAKTAAEITDSDLPENSGSDERQGEFAGKSLVKVQWRSIRTLCISVARDDEAP